MNQDFECPRCGRCCLQQTKQEPVAYVSSLDFDDDDQEIIPAKDKGKLGTSNCDIPLYTTPKQERLAQLNEFEPDWDQVEALQESLREHMAEINRLRQWQGLTDQEINSVCYKRDWTAPWTDLVFARAIEAKLREKNQ